MVISLNLIDKNKRGLPVFHLVSGYDAQRKIEISHGLRLCKDTVTQFVCFHVNLYVVWKQLLPHLTNDKGLAYLTGTVYNHHLIGII